MAATTATAKTPAPDARHGPADLVAHDRLDARAQVRPAHAGDPRDRRADGLAADLENRFRVVARVTAGLQDCLVAGAFALVDEPRLDPPDGGMEPVDRFHQHVQHGHEIVAAPDVTPLVRDHGAQLRGGETLDEPVGKQQHRAKDADDARFQDGRRRQNDKIGWRRHASARVTRVAPRNAMRIGVHWRHQSPTTTATPALQAASSSHGHIGVEGGGTNSRHEGGDVDRRQHLFHDERDGRLHGRRRRAPLKPFADADQRRQRHQKLDRRGRPQPAAHARGVSAKRARGDPDGEHEDRRLPEVVGQRG